MSRTLTRPMFRKGGMAQREKYMGGGITTPRIKRMGGGLTGIMSGIRPDAGLTPRVGYQEGTGPEYKFSETPVAKGIESLAAYGPNSLLAAITDFGAVPLNTLGRAFGYNPGFSGTKLVDTLTGGKFSEFTGYDPDKAYFFGVPTSAKEGFTLPSMKEEKIEKKGEPKITNIPPPPKKEDPEKSLMDVYGENKGIIDQVMGSADEDTKKSMYLQLAKFGAGLLAEPGGDLVGAVGQAAAKPLEGVEATLAEKRKGEKDTKLMALQKTFDDMKEPDQIKLVKSIQKEYGFDTFKEAYDFISKPKKSSAEINAENKFYRETATNMGVSTEGFRREMEKLDEKGFGKYIGNFTRPDALLPDDIDDRVNGEYYVTSKGQAVRFIDGTLYTMEDPEFTKKIETKET
jgi:hypothetical protein